MSAWNKALLSYFTYFGGTIVFLTVCGQWDAVNGFLKRNPALGVVASVVFILISYICHDAVDKVDQIEFDKRRRPRKGPRAGKKRR
ncbi:MULTISPECIES: hypothetical protein [unclassified Hyphomonas]|uniref:hypothetical protein n=1 Tax=unclassified Hyphomonas TaxID=2630699 RepID=UPI0004590C20|nr:MULTISPECIES: hypothetical protein [unclassified Hyphomonas]KCZ49903.1 hypothetical protein HY17_02025 [Hyphomonas sp. CY54-11-8]